MISRRSFLRLGAGAVPVLGLPSWIPLRAHHLLSADGLALGLFFDPEALPGLRARYRQYPLFAGLRAELVAIDRDAERRFMNEEVQLNDHLYHIIRLYNVAPRLAFLHAMTGDADAADLAAEAVRTILRFPKWDYFLDGEDRVLGIQRASGSVVAVACTADWLGDYLDADERAHWLGIMGERGCEACFRSVHGMRHPEGAGGWHIDPESTYLTHRPYDLDLDLANWPYILDRTNLKAVPASALAIGAVAYERQFGRDDRTDRWVEQAAYSVGTFGSLYAPDGSYDEGLSYGNYTSLHLAQATEVLARHRGIDLYDAINWPGFIDYAAGMALPSDADPYGIVNFGDAGTGLHSSVPFWVAARYGDARAQWFGEDMTQTHSEWSLLWLDPDVEAEAPPEGPSLWQSDLGWITARTGYAADDLVVALRSGGPANHEHADRGALVVKAFGEVLVADPYRPPYSNDDPAWLLRTTAGHSALLIDGQGHQYHDGMEGTNASDAVAHLTRSGRRRHYMYWTSDATPAYRLVLPHVEAVTRTVYVFHALPAVLILDKVVTDGTPVRLQARYFGDNRDDGCSIEGSGARFRTTRPGAVLHGHAYAGGGATASARTLPIPEERAVQHPFAEAATEAASSTPLLATVLAPAGSDEPAPAVTFSPAGGGFVVELEHRGRRLSCEVRDTGTVPEVILRERP